MTKHNYVNKCLRWLTTALVDEAQKDSVSLALQDKLDKCFTAITSAIDWENLTYEDVKQLGFMCYGEEEESEDSLWLIPIWLYPAIPEGLTCYMMESDRKFIFNRRNATYSNFYGCLEYGIKFTATLQEESND